MFFVSMFHCFWWFDVFLCAAQTATCQSYFFWCTHEFKNWDVTVYLPMTRFTTHFHAQKGWCHGCPKFQLVGWWKRRGFFRFTPLLQQVSMMIDGMITSSRPKFLFFTKFGLFFYIWYFPLNFTTKFGQITPIFGFPVRVGTQNSAATKCSSFRIRGDEHGWTLLKLTMANVCACLSLIVPSGYVNIAIENCHRNSGFSHWTWWFSIVFCMFTRG